MTDVIHLDKISSGNCDCNKPKKPTSTCGCLLVSLNNCSNVTPDSDRYFKVANLFGELRSEWLRAEARTNLGVTEIVKLELIKEGKGSNDTNIWEMVVSKGGSLRVYDFVVRNGDSGRDGKSATVKVVGTATSDDGVASVENVGPDDSNVRLYFTIPKGPKGDKGDAGDAGKSAYDLAVQEGFVGNLQAWLESLKGADGVDGKEITNIRLAEVRNVELTLPNGDLYSGKAIVWRVVFNNDTFKDFWVPLTVNNGDSGELPLYRYNVFLFKKLHFEEVPEPSELALSIIDVLTGLGSKTETLLKNEGWRDTAEIVQGDGRDYVLMASCIVTNEVYGRWTVVNLTGTPGKDGDKGTSGLGLVGPVVRMRGNWDSTISYVNETYKPYSNNLEVHYIDVVYYPETKKWYEVARATHSLVSGVVVPTNTPPTNPEYWTLATTFDFAFIDTLIANNLRSVTVDADEVRIHGGSNRNLIVAGMTGGRNVVYDNDGNEFEENITNVNNANGSPVRIWAGTEFNIEGGNNNFNLNTAKFRVHLDGHLYAEDADIVGTVLANILRLGEGSFISGTDEIRTKVLPKLLKNKVQMFYLLTDEMSNGVFTLSPENGDKIKYLDVNAQEFVVTSNGVPLKPKKLYQLFGIDHDLNSPETNHDLIWHLVELNLAAIDVTATSVSGGVVPSSCYSVSYYIIIQDTVDNSNTNDSTGTLSPQGTIYLSITNNYVEDITVHIATIPFDVSFGIGAEYSMEVHCVGLTITKEAHTYNHSFSYTYLNLSDDIISVNFINADDLAGANTSVVNTPPTITINSEEVSGSDNPYMEYDSSYIETGKYKYLFKSALISATY